MPWTTPPTFTSGQTITAAFLNGLRDNLNETAVAKATASGRIVVSAGAKQLAERVPSKAYVGDAESNTNTSYVNLATIGPDVEVTTGTRALVMLVTGSQNNTVDKQCFYSYAVSGATTLAADDNNAVRHTSVSIGAQSAGSFAYIVTLDAGVNLFRGKYRVNAGGGTWFDRRISVVPF